MKAHPFKAIRRAGVSLSWFETPDPAATIAGCVKACNGLLAGVPVLAWDCASGLRALGGDASPGAEYVRDIQDPESLKYPQSCIAWLLAHLPVGNVDGKSKGGVVFMSNLGRFLGDPQVMQAVWNARDVFKSALVSLVILGPSSSVPAELSHDIIVISEELTKAEELGAVVDSICQDAEIGKPEGQERERCVNTLLGLSAFEAEQVTALSVTGKGIDLGGLWERKVKAIEATPGLAVYRGKEGFADLGGLENGKKILGDTITGKSRVSLIVFADEIDKGMAASGSDTSGTTQDQLKALLCYIQDNDVLGGLFLGPPGTGKTALAKAAAGQHGIPMISLDLGALKGSLVGQSEQNMRQALKVIHAVSDGRALFLGACNRVEGLPPELRRRYSYISLFFDLPDEAERAPIWAVWKAKYNLQPEQCDAVKDDGWTGAEIRNCCLKAWAMNCKLSEAAQTIVPVSKSAGDMIESLRRSASGRYISASKPGLYTATVNPPAAVSTGRRMDK